MEWLSGNWQTLLYGILGAGGIAILPIIWNVFLSRVRVVNFGASISRRFSGLVSAYDVPVIGGKFEAGLKARFLGTKGDFILGLFIGEFHVDRVKLRDWLKEQKSNAS